MNRKRSELESSLGALAERVVGAGHLEAPGVYVELREPAEIQEPEGAHPITRSYDTIAKIRVNDPDGERAARHARAIADALDTDWAEQEYGGMQILHEPGSNEVDGLFTLERSDTETSD